LWEEDSSTSSVRLPQWGSMRNGELCRRRPWVPPISASESSSWPTVRSRDGDSPNQPRCRRDSTPPQHSGAAATLWPTPDAALLNEGADPEKHSQRQGRLKEKHDNGNGAETPLGMAVKMWATPTSHERTHSPRDVDHGEQLANQVDLWATPTGNDHKGGVPADDRNTTNARQAGQTERSWATPAATDGQKAPKCHKGGNLSLPEQVRRGQPCSSPQDQPTTAGPTSSPITPGLRRRLNPAFVCWLMGLPWWWANPALTSCVRQEMLCAVTNRPARVPPSLPLVLASDRKIFAWSRLT